MQLQRLLIYFAFITIATAAGENITQLVSQLPQCSLRCFLANPTVIQNPVGTCSNETAQASLSTCIQRSCSRFDQFQVGIINGQVCKDQPVNLSRVRDVSITGFVCVPLALIFIAIRLYSRATIIRDLGFDDGLMVLVGLVMISLLVLDHYNGTKNGMGRHFWAVDLNKSQELLKIFWVVQIFYITVITMVKSSILIFYLRVFKCNHRFSIVSYVVLAAVISSGAAIAFLVIFQCNPVAGVWDILLPAKCLNINKLTYATSFIGIGLDVIILIMPIPPCIQLKMGLRKKLLVIFMFSLGIFACVTSIVRLKFIVAFGGSTDPTWDNAIPAIWSFIEITVAIICACLPSLRYILARIFPVIFDISSDPSQAAHEDIYKGTPYSSATYNRQIPSRASEKENQGPMFSRRVITSPDDAFLRDLEEEWTTPPIHDNESVVATMGSTHAHSSMYGSIHDSSDTSMFALEGPRLSDDSKDSSFSEKYEMTDAKKPKNSWSLGLDFSRHSGRWLQR